jgi:hypothetical protein
LIDIETAFRVLAEGQVEFIVVGGVAARAHGSARLTNDLDVVYRRTPENIDRLASTLAPYSPYLRGAPAGLPFRFDVDAIRRGLNFTLTTSFGDLDDCLIQIKRAAGRPRDFDAIAELEALLEERQRRDAR